MIQQDRLCLVDADWVRHCLEIRNFGVNQSDPSLTVVLECGWGEKASYLEGHIPSAVYLDTDEIEADQRLEPRNWWNLRPPQVVLDTLAGLGISARSTVILYSRDPLAAARVAWLLLTVGHNHICWLDGGWTSWIARGLPVEQGPGQHQPIEPADRWEFANPEYCWSLERLKTSLNMRSEDLVLVDIRSKAEHLGESSGYPYVNKAGQIPGSVWGGGGSDSSSLQDFLNDNHTLKPLQQIESRWKTVGIVSSKQAIFYCGTGWRASVAFLCAYLLGWRNIALFDGGWFEWSSQTRGISENCENTNR